MKKSLFAKILVFVMIVACMLAITSCKLFKKDHTHSYTQTTLAPTCTEGGKAVYTCSCGHSYSEDNGNAAIGHDLKSQKGSPATCTTEGYDDYEACSRCDYSTKVVVPATGHYYSASEIVYPSLTETGNRTMTCVACGDSYSTDISATGVSLPRGSELISALVGEISFFASLDENTMIIQSTETDDLGSCNGSKSFTKFTIGEVEFTSAGGSIEGYVRVAIHTDVVVLDGSVDPDTVTPKSFEEVADIYIYFNDNYISYEDLSRNDAIPEGKIDLTEAVYTFIFGMLGYEGEDLNKALYTAAQFADISDDLVAILNAFSNISLPETGEEYNKALEAITAIVNSEIFTSTTDANGNITYKTNLSVLAEYIDIIDGKTVSELIDFTYGAGSAAALREFAVNLPYMTIKDIANFAITFAENYDADVDAVFSFVDLIIFTSTGESVNVKYLIDTELNITIAEILLSDDSDKTAEEYAEEISSSIAIAIDSIYPLNFDQLYNVIAYGDPDYVDENGNKFSLIDTLKTLFEEIDDVISFEMTTDAEGFITDMCLVYGPVTATVSIDGDNLDVVIDYPDVLTAELSITSSSIEFSVYTPDCDIVSGSYIVTEENGALVYSANFFFEDIQLLYFDAIVVDGELADYNLRVDKYEMVEVEWTDDDGYNHTQYVEEITTILSVDYNVGDEFNSWIIVADNNEIIIEIRENNGKTKYNFYNFVDDELTARAEITREQTDVDCFKYEGVISDDKFDVLKFSYEVCEGVLIGGYYEYNEISKDGEYIFPEDPEEAPVWVEGEPYISNTIVYEYAYDYDTHSYSIATYDKDGKYEGGCKISAEQVDNVYTFFFEMPKAPSGSNTLGGVESPDSEPVVNYYYFTEIFIGLVIEIR